MTLRAAALVAGVVLLLAGCSTIPMSGPVQPGTTEAPNGTQLVYVPSEPSVGASPQEIVTGFLTAASGGGSFRVAKEYLTDAFAKRWNPKTRVLVQETQSTLTGTGSSIRATIPLSASVDTNGVYTALTGDRTLPFRLVQERGQWRIDFAEDGIVLTQPVFQTNYQPQLLQFFDPTWTRLVPDRRWFPGPRDDRTPDMDVRPVLAALIKGPRGPLAGVATNALRDARIAGISPSSDGVTTVTLTTSGPTPSSTITGRMQQQLVLSLGLRTPASLRLVVNDLVMPQAKPIADQLTLDAYVLVDGRFGTLSPAGQFSEERTLGAKIAATRPTAVTVSLSQKLAAVQTASGEVELITQAGARPIDSRADLADPTVDQRGWVYTATQTGALRAANGKTAGPVASDLGDGTVTAIQASPDGTRLLVLMEATSGPRAAVYGIERDGSGRPTALTRSSYSVDLGTAAGTGFGAAWVDDDDVAVLINGSDSDQILTQQLGGLAGKLGSFANVTSIAGTTSSDDLRIQVQSGQTGTVYIWNNTNWQQQSTGGTDVDVLAVQR